MMVRASSALLGPQEIDVLIERRGAEAGLIEEIETLADLGASWDSFRGQVDVHLHDLVGRNQDGRSARAELVGNALALQLAGDGPGFFARKVLNKARDTPAATPTRQTAAKRQARSADDQPEDLSSPAHRLPAIPQFYELAHSVHEARSC